MIRAVGSATPATERALPKLLDEDYTFSISLPQQQRGF